MLDDDARQWLSNLLGPAVRFNETLAKHTTFRIGGPADAFAEPEHESQLTQVIQWAQHNKIPWWVMGGGSNLLVRDHGIRGVVIRLSAMTDVQWEVEHSAVHLTAGAGLPTKQMCALALRYGWRGMNFALGIPGTLGGAILMNAGTAQGCMADVLTAVTVITAAGKKRRVTRDQLQFQYRGLQWPGSVEDKKRQAIVLAAELKLAMADRDNIRRQARGLMQARVQRQGKRRPCAGSFFKNPSTDLPAGRLIDQAGLKGVRIGDAQVSRRHANFIVNRGHATAEEVLRLMDRIQKRVKAEFGIDLTPEVCIVGQEAGAQKPL